MGKYQYESGNKKFKGEFNVYQAKSGAITLLMNKVHTALTLRQVNELNINCYELEEYNHDDFEHYYLKSKNAL